MRFTLVHGGLHGAWCWERLIPQLEALGHEAVAVELPGHGTRRTERSTLAGYRDAVLESLRPDDVLVGHSTGCPVATLAADALPEIRHIVYLAGPLPVEGKPLAFDSGGGRQEDGTVSTMSDFEDGADKHLRVTDDGQFFTMTYEGAVACFFHDCDAGTAAWAPTPRSSVTRLSSLACSSVHRRPVRSDHSTQVRSSLMLILVPTTLEIRARGQPELAVHLRARGSAVT